MLSSYQYGELGSHLASLVQLLKVGLEDARDVFAGRGPSDALSRRNGGRSGTDQGIPLLDVLAEATQLDSNVNSDFVTFIQGFLER